MFVWVCTCTTWLDGVFAMHTQIYMIFCILHCYFVLVPLPPQPSPSPPVPKEGDGALCQEVTGECMWSSQPSLLSVVIQ